jgi:CRP/FNR family transcriptional regulator, cyclic AMP receptor protein
MADIKFLQNIELFRGLEERYLRLIKDLLREASFGPGERIINEPIPGESLFIITSGKVRVSLTFEGEHFVLTELGTHDYFGEMSLIDDHAAVANVEAVTQTKLLVLSRADFKALVSSSTELSAKMWEALARNLNSKIRKTDELVKVYYGLSKALCENPQFRELFASWNFKTPIAE